MTRVVSRRERIATAVLAGTIFEGWDDHEVVRIAIRRADALIDALDEGGEV